MIARIDKTCATCGGHNVVVGARVYWDVAAQAWAIDDVYPDTEAWCEDCEAMVALCDVNAPT